MYCLILIGKVLSKLKNKKLNYELISFFILPPSREVFLKDYIKRRKEKKLLKMRMEQFDKDVLHWKIMIL